MENFENSGFWRLFSPELSFAVTAVGFGEPLHAEELNLLSPKAKQYRRQTLTAGRNALRKAISQIGIQLAGPILKGERGEPILPDGVTGSLSHSGLWSIAAVTNSHQIVGLGIDLQEIVQGERKNLEQRIASAVEMQWLDGSALNLLKLFSIKESVYKALAPSLKRFIGFREVEIFPAELDNEQFLVEPAASDIDELCTANAVSARCATFGDYILSVVEVRQIAKASF